VARHPGCKKSNTNSDQQAQQLAENPMGRRGELNDWRV
jgi:hypothetical protein